MEWRVLAAVRSVLPSVIVVAVLAASGWLCFSSPTLRLGNERSVVSCASLLPGPDVVYPAMSGQSSEFEQYLVADLKVGELPADQQQEERQLALTDLRLSCEDARHSRETWLVLLLAASLCGLMAVALLKFRAAWRHVA